MIRPLSRNHTVSATSRVKPTSCVTTIILMPSCASDFITRSTNVVDEDEPER
jgi:hypothetical protein